MPFNFFLYKALSDPEESEDEEEEADEEEEEEDEEEEDDEDDEEESEEEEEESEEGGLALFLFFLTSLCSGEGEEEEDEEEDEALFFLFLGRERTWLLRSSEAATGSFSIVLQGSKSPTLLKIISHTCNSYHLGKYSKLQERIYLFLLTIFTDSLQHFHKISDNFEQ